MPKGFFKYDWALIQRYYDEGHGYLQCRAEVWLRKGHMDQSDLPRVDRRKAATMGDFACPRKFEEPVYREAPTSRSGPPQQCMRFVRPIRMAGQTYHDPAYHLGLTDLGL